MGAHDPDTSGQGSSEAPSADLALAGGTGPLWGLASADLNATLLSWPVGEGVAEHVNAELDVLLVVVDGSGSLWVDGRRHDLRPLRAVLVEKGRARRIEAGEAGLRYLSVHVRRAPLAIAPLELG